MLGIILPVLGFDFHITIPFRVDDWEENVTNLTVRALPSNETLIPTNNITIEGLSYKKLLSLQTATNATGESLLDIIICDNGWIADRTREYEITYTGDGTEVLTNDEPLKPIITQQPDGIRFQWEDTTNKLEGFPYKIVRSTNSIGYPPTNTFHFRTVGVTTNTEFLDTNVVSGTKYYYLINWVPWYATNAQQIVECTNLIYTIRVSPVVKTFVVDNGFGFQGYSGKTYTVLYKTDFNSPTWEKYLSVSADADHLFIFRGEQYDGKIIYVREED